MARLPAAPESVRSRATRFCMWLMRRAMGRDLTPYRVAAHASRVVPCLVAMNMAFETGRWALEPGLRKLIHLRVASLIGCVF
jgi:alkylhydroperoxidase family enzyme